MGSLPKRKKGLREKRPGSETDARVDNKAAPAAETAAALADRAREILGILASQYPDARCLLDYRNPFELLIATILAAQCTDERVNKVTPTLFSRFPTPEAMARASIEELEELIRSTGFFHSKAKAIKGASEAIAALASGFPRTMEGLVALPGVGRKTANVVLGNCFGIPSIIVDTHLGRITQRLALVKTDNPDRIEEELHKIVHVEDWTRFSHAGGFHGRHRCHAKKPDCPHCPVLRLCPWPSKTEPTG
jgi:endonuclease-3